MLLVDAANVVGSRPDGWWRDRAGAAGRLVAALRRGVTEGCLDAPLTVVLEGRARAGAPKTTESGVTVVHADGSGDDELVRLAQAQVAGESVVVVTADRELQRRLAAAGAETVGPSWLIGRIGRRTSGT